MLEERAVRLVALDLDGTLLDDSKRVGERTASAIRGLVRRGVKVVIASARPPRSVRSIYRELDLDTYQINYNGAMVWDEVRGRVIHHRPMESGLVRRMVERARALFPGILVSCEVLDRWYTDRFDPSHTTETGKTFRPDVVAPLETFLGQPFTKLLFLGETGEVLELEDRIGRDFGSEVAVVRSDPDLIQIMDRRASKANALRLVAEGYGVAMEEVLAVGDAPNDVEMLREAGISVAVGNAHPLAKAAARWVAPSNNDEGVLAALQRYVPGDGESRGTPGEQMP